jgi:serine protease AprX
MARCATLFVACFVAATTNANAADVDYKLDAALRTRARSPRGVSRVIVRTAGAVRGRVVKVADTALLDLAARPDVRAISLDRRVRGTMERTGPTVGAPWVWEALRLDGSGIGIAIVDSGVTSWHDDLTGRVVHFADFVNHQPTAYDDFGHGTHVAGIIAGSGYDSGGARRGIAPGASLVVLKALDGGGDGYVSNVIAAIDYAIQRRTEFNIRVINLSVAAGVYESYTTDPLTLACKRAVDAGIVVVTSAGNFGRDADGKPRQGAITAPGNAPWVLTVGAASHQGTPDRTDDTLAPFSSRGPASIDGAAKPDLLAPGVGIESLADSGSLLFTTRPSMRLWGTVQTASEPYLSLTGTSMASPVVSGTIALMLQANPALTPNLVKAVLQYTAEEREAYSHLAQGAGFLNSRGAVQLAQALADPLASSPKDPTSWSRHIIWGNRRVGGGVLKPSANAWRVSLVWGAATSEDGDNIVWGTRCAERECDDILWAAAELGGEEWSPDDAGDSGGGPIFTDDFASAGFDSPAADAGRAFDGGGSHAVIARDRFRVTRPREGAAA